MKKLTSLLSVLLFIATVNAQNSYDTALQSASIYSSNKASDLYTQKNSLSFTNNDLEPLLAKNEINIMPAKGSKNIQLEFNASKVNDATITVLDLEGKIVLNQNAHLSVGKNNVVIENLISLAEGNYTIKLNSNNATYSSSFLLWK